MYNYWNRFAHFRRYFLFGLENEQRRTYFIYDVHIHSTFEVKIKQWAKCNVRKKRGKLNYKFGEKKRHCEVTKYFESFFVGTELGVVVIGDLGVHDQLVLGVVFQISKDRLRHVGVNL